MRNRSYVLVAVWLLGTGFAMAMASFAVRLAGAGVTDGALPVMAHSDISAELYDASSTGTSLLDLTAVATVLEPEETPGAPTPVPAGPATPPTTTPSSGGSSGSGSSGSGSSGPGSGSTGATGAGAPSGGASGSSSSGSGSSSSGSGSGATPTTAPTTTATTAPAAVTQAIVSHGGTVTVRCVGTTVSIVAASPNGGYVVDVRDQGPREVEVRFEGADHTSTVKASCVAGSVEPKVQESGKD